MLQHQPCDKDTEGGSSSAERYVPLPNEYKYTEEGSSSPESYINYPDLLCAGCGLLFVSSVMALGIYGIILGLSE